MGLEVQKKKDGSLRSKWWYGRFTVDGVSRCVNLGVEVSGRVPSRLRDRGDDVFEYSRMKAHVKLEGLIAEAHNRKTAAHHLAELYEIKAGESITQVPLLEMEEQFDLLPMKRKRSARQIKHKHATIRQFRDYVTERYPGTGVMSQVTKKMAVAWLRDLDAKGLTAATYNVKLSLLRSLFEQLGPDAGVITNPFAGIPYRALNTVHRQPFTQDELTALLDHCDELIRPVVLTGMCTAMRRGDCCLLKWDSVDLENGFISVKTSKTGELAEIPLFPLLRMELEGLPRKGAYCFPDAAAMYKENVHGISWRFKKALKDAGIKDTLVDRDDARQRASVKDFHSLRTTWITMALSAGVPMELVRRVTGHSTVDVVLKHYFRPGREAFRSALTAAMPKMLTGGGGPDDGEPRSEKPLVVVRWLLKHGADMGKEEILRKLAEIEPMIEAV